MGAVGEIIGVLAHDRAGLVTFGLEVDNGVDGVVLSVGVPGAVVVVVVAEDNGLLLLLLLLFSVLLVFSLLLSLLLSLALVPLSLLLVLVCW